MRITSRLLVWLLCAGALALAGPLVRSSSTAASTRDGGPLSAFAATVAARTMSPGEAAESRALLASLQAQADSAVLLTLRVANPGNAKHEIRFPDGRTHEFVVLDDSGGVVWHSGEGRLFTQGIRNKLLAPQRSVSYEERWDSEGRSGRFTAVATLRSSSDPLQERVTFTLP
ncbi:MAG: BsuPI-related putative proteinase inhibitor [Gemmatimonadaceae bacterium]